MRYLGIFALGVLFMAGCSKHPSQPKPPAQQPQQAAQDAIGVLQKLVNEQNYKSLGFDSLDQVRRAQLAPPLQVYNIGLDRLKSYQAGQDPNTLLTQSTETMYPVTVDGQVKTGVTIVHNESGYTPSSFGNADIVKRLAGNRHNENEFVVRIPAFNMYFVGRRVEDRLVLVPIVEDPRLKVEQGQAVPIEVVLDQLKPYVDAYNGLPM
ncbi:hypothetical protein [Pseudacidobacterium ailaaui]|jgi:hypothetical protein|uniref:hypothetical protein n=1 Tax=Pseudacidobacterium ailaaui TaxID=1382359 RepID=UPI000479FD6C|nr:hypothetical protein [Pseudacidobacterium ailaaui]MBX6360304.1 hypothetical protein [Pseudacidobacterium ailaaui]MCL6465071.1 hypothetical protein [Pseudacidobacterium ailaaui]MDI3254505.1 hypothetical protein [Bacillota bacterium]